MRKGESQASCGEALEGNRSAVLKILQAEEISTVTEANVLDASPRSEPSETARLPVLSA